MHEKSLHGDGDIVSIRGSVFVRAPKRPFPWWGSFDATNAIGRSFLLFGLVWLGSLFVRMLLLRDSDPWQTQPYYSRREGIFDIWLVLNIGETGLLIAAGMGILLRKNIGILMMRIFVIWLPLKLLYLMLRPFFRYGGFPDEIIGLVVISITAYMTFVGTIAVALWLYFKKAPARYEFGYIDIRYVKRGTWGPTRIFGYAVGAVGIAPILLSLAILITLATAGGSDEPIPILIFLGLFAFGIALSVSGFCFSSGLNGGRIAIRVIAFVALIFLVILFVLFLISRTFTPSSIAVMPAFQLAGSGAGLLAFGATFYVLLEIVRYLRSERARAWCGYGSYIPPWTEQIKAAEAMEESEILERPPMPDEEGYEPPHDGG
ncbi:MAG: hypothetical protein ACYS8W_14030 [Planctomycetota bacterium]|jgi:hypothetical protein